MKSFSSILQQVRPSFIVIFLLVISIVILYYPVTKYGFVNFDDVNYVVKNNHVRDGLTLEGVKWAFFAFYEANWHPLTWISHMIDIQLFGMDPGKFHSVNIIIHSLNAVLLFLFFSKSTGKIGVSSIIAALFAIHPTHVESVAWIAERKDVLSFFFMMLTLISYLKYVSSNKKIPYYVSLFFFALGLMSKPMLVTLPFLLILIDYWPLERLFSTKNNISNETQIIKNYHIIEKIPFFIISAISSLITILAQKTGGAVVSINDVSLDMRIGNAVISYIKYLSKIFIPNDLATPYPYPEKISLGIFFIFLIIILTFSILSLYTFKSRRYVLFGWLWFLGTLVPVIGIVQVGSQSMADRYLYIPAIGIYVIIAMSSYNEAIKDKSNKKIFAFLLTVFFIFLAFKSRVQTSYWENGASLFENAIKVTKNNTLAYYNLANEMSGLGNSDKAIEYYLKAININPSEAPFHTNLGIEYKTKGDYGKAFDHFSTALQLNPDLVEALCNMALILFEKYDSTEEAKNYLSRAIQLKPDYFFSYTILGNIMLVQGDIKEAARLYSRAISLNPDDADAYNGLGAAFVKIGELNEAETFFAEAIAIKPEKSEYRNNLERVRQQLNKK